jgi:cytidine deaminase
MKQIKLAAEMMARAYAPYSRFQVGCVVETHSGKTYGGCNVENASYPATICAERSAISNSVADGSQDIKTIYLVASSEAPCLPCGICLQVISEFGRDIKIVCASNDQKTIEEYKLSDLLPHGFNKTFLNA